MKKVPASVTDADISRLFVDLGYSIETIYRFEPESITEQPIMQKRRYRTYSVLLGSQAAAKYVAAAGQLKLPTGATILIEWFNHKSFAKAQKIATTRDSNHELDRQQQANNNRH